ncbi:beta-1,3-galactosyltransferase 5 [Patella vulgata]|uniref:beta-1,3-galactosyltransferase 5 n=1 Tax=Patella vulgata TaxID=6465 RepID=UPI0024A815FD|nr:beta-1,3-galactosyltransferase 5 [Patella vulgata]
MSYSTINSIYLKFYLLVFFIMTIFAVVNMFTSLKYIRESYGSIQKFEPMTNVYYIKDFQEYNTKNDNLAHSSQSEVDVSSSKLPKLRSESSDIKRPYNCSDCFKHNFQYIILNKKICDVKRDTSVELFLFILTIHQNIKQRTMIRNTWLSISKNNTSDVRYVFLLGKSMHEAMNRKAIEEAAIFNDIIMEDFKDSYQNLTYKTIMGLKYVSNYCKQTKYVFKTDDDMWINIPALQRLLKTDGHKLETAVGGACRQSSNPIRKKSSKWYASYSRYPGKTYPGFCSGTGYVLSVNVAQKVFEISKDVPFYHLEDVYVALCARKLGFKLIRLRGFVIPRKRNNTCVLKSDKVITSHRVPPKSLKAIWEAKC